MAYFKMFKEVKILQRQAKIIVTRSKHSNEGFTIQTVTGESSSKRSFHQPQTSTYPATKMLPLPLNIKDLVSSEKLKFSPQRNREITGSFISSSSSSSFEDYPTDPLLDEKIQCYDCSGTINLSSVMQTNVPFPFRSKGKPVHLNMPGGQWGQKEKYVSEDMNNAHQKNFKESDFRSGGSFPLSTNMGVKCFSIMDRKFSYTVSSIFSTLPRSQLRNYCSEKNKIEPKDNEKENVTKIDAPKLSSKEKLKLIVKDYGATAVIFHVGISLLSLGTCYLLISSGVDLTKIFKSFGVDEGAATAGTAAQFVIAYSIHKSLAPGRFATTLAVVPFIVKKLRKMGILKTPPGKV